MLSKFDLTVQYVPGKENVVADAMSRFAYPTCKAFQDVSVHGSAEARDDVKRIIAEELAETRTVGMIIRNGEAGLGATTSCWFAGRSQGGKNYRRVGSGW